MRPHSDDADFNLTVGREMRLEIHRLAAESSTPTELDYKVGETLNLLAQKMYDLGQREAVLPHMN